MRRLLTIQDRHEAAGTPLVSRVLDLMLQAALQEPGIWNAKLWAKVAATGTRPSNATRRAGRCWLRGTPPSFSLSRPLH